MNRESCIEHERSSRDYNTASIIVVTTLQHWRGYKRKIEGEILGREMKINIKCLSLENVWISV